tara:strand:+ start:1125 stop:1388 length:264 start_codon:yes stop_codon:yes gene_type:complete
MAKINQRIGLIKIREEDEAETEFRNIDSIIEREALNNLNEDQIAKIVKQEIPNADDLILEIMIPQTVSMVAKGQLTKDGYNFQPKNK